MQALVQVGLAQAPKAADLAEASKGLAVPSGKQPNGPAKDTRDDKVLHVITIVGLATPAALFLLLVELIASESLCRAST